MSREYTIEIHEPFDPSGHPVEQFHQFAGHSNVFTGKWILREDVLLDVLKEMEGCGHLERINERKWRLAGAARKVKRKYGMDPDPP